MSVVRTGANMALLNQTQAARAPAQAAGTSVSGDWRAPARVRLGTLNNLRWLAVVGQTTALLFVRIILNFDFQLVLCSTVVAASAILNVILAIGFPSSKRLTVREAAAFL